MINYDLGRTKCRISWETDIKEQCKAPGIRLSEAAKKLFSGKKAQGGNAAFSWDRVEKDKAEAFDFLIAQDDSGSESSMTSKVIVFMLVKQRWLPDPDTAEKVVGTWQSEAGLPVLPLNSSFLSGHAFFAS